MVHQCHFVVLSHVQQLKPCCNQLDPNNACTVMTFFTYQGSLNGVRWLDGMGVNPLGAVLNAIRSGHRKILKYLLSKYKISLCDNALDFVSSQSSCATMLWCIDKSLIRSIDPWIRKLIYRKIPCVKKFHFERIRFMREMSLSTTSRLQQLYKVTTVSECSVESAIGGTPASA